MAFSFELTQYLSGTTKSQLNRWAREGILIPEVNPSRPKIYSFRDIVALRVIAYLRSQVSLQKIRKALSTLEDYDYQEHLSTYRFASDGKSVKLWNENGFMDLVEQPGQYELLGLEDIYKPFENWRGRHVPDLRSPSDGISIEPARIGGTPTLEGTRVPFDMVVELQKDMTAEEVVEYYPSINAEGIRAAVDFDLEIRQVAS